MTSDYGTYRLVFEPPTDQITPGVEMTLSGEADLTQMLAFFEAFLQASGYVFKGELQIVDPEPDLGLWALTSKGSQGTDFVPLGSISTDDTFFFGAK